MNVFWGEPYMGELTVVRACAKCTQFIPDIEYNFNFGLCPYCGNTSNTTVIDTVNVSARFQYRRFLHVFPVPTGVFVAYVAENSN